MSSVGWLAFVVLLQLEPFPTLPPLTDIYLLPPEGVLKSWLKEITHARSVVGPRLHDRTLPSPKRLAYRAFANRLSKSEDRVLAMKMAHDATRSTKERRLRLHFLRQSFPEEYNSGRWNPPVPLELLPEDERHLFVKP
jgi:hypothetical protein